MNLKQMIKEHITIVISGLVLVLSIAIIYLYYCNQNLLEIDKTINLHEQTLNKINTKIDMQNINNNDIEEELKHIKIQLNNYRKILINKENNNDLLSNEKEEDNKDFIFKPIDTNKFPTFKDVIGCENIIDQLNDFLLFIKEQQRFQKIGDVETPSGILFYGVPGTGKTFIARALAKEANLPFFDISSSTFSKTYKGQGPQAVKDLFASARMYAAKSNGAIIFIDECEAAFADVARLDQGRDSEIINVVNTFKEEMTSYLNDPKKPIFIIGATNHPEQIEEAIKSRLTYQIDIEPSNKEGRQKYLELRIKKRNNPYSQEAKEYLYYVVNEALEYITESSQIFKKTNRSLENILKSAVANFAKRRNINDVDDKISKEDVKKAYAAIINKDTVLLDAIEQKLLDAKNAKKQ